MEEQRRVQEAEIGGGRQTSTSETGQQNPSTNTAGSSKV